MNVDATGKVVAPLYNYLKPYPEHLQQQFYQTYGGETAFAKQTASPVLGNLNSGIQLYRLKYQQPEAFAHIAVALHLPQYICYILTGKTFTDITSIGCHTNLWDFENNQYHPWVKQQGADTKFAAILPCESVAGYVNETMPAGAGLHDSFAALIPYLAAFPEPFILLSTDTWCISLNPFNNQPLSDDELHQDCLCYLTYQGTSVKASRLFAGYEHEQQIKKLAEHFNQPLNHFSGVEYDTSLIKNYTTHQAACTTPGNAAMVAASSFGQRDLNDFKTYEAAYHQFIFDLIQQQVQSTNVVLQHTVKRIFVDGGFSKNSVYMHLLAYAFHIRKSFQHPQASALALPS